MCVHGMKPLIHHNVLHCTVHTHFTTAMSHCLFFCVHTQTKVEDVPAQSSTYRRRSQAFSKSSSVPTVTSPTLTSPTGSESKAVITIEQVVSPRRVSEPCKPSENILKGECDPEAVLIMFWCLLNPLLWCTIVEDTSGLSPAIARTKSTTRRKPKEKRRSTGIPTEVRIVTLTHYIGTCIACCCAVSVSWECYWHQYHMMMSYSIHPCITMCKCICTTG